jgi:hypothetical protein
MPCLPRLLSELKRADASAGQKCSICTPGQCNYLHRKQVCSIGFGFNALQHSAAGNRLIQMNFLDSSSCTSWHGGGSLWDNAAK